MYIDSYTISPVGYKNDHKVEETRVVIFWSIFVHQAHSRQFIYTLFTSIYTLQNRYRLSAYHVIYGIATWIEIVKWLSHLTMSKDPPLYISVPCTCTNLNEDRPILSATKM